MPEPSRNRRRLQPDLRQLAGIKPAKGLLFGEFCKKFSVLRRKRLRTSTASPTSAMPETPVVLGGNSAILENPSIVVAGRSALRTVGI